jgi:hypothetical protein
LLPPTAATRCLRSTLPPPVTTSFIRNCETEVVPLQNLHSSMPLPPPPPSFAPARLRWFPFNIHMRRCHHRHQHHPHTRQKGGNG